MVKLNNKTKTFLSEYNLYETDEIQQVQLQHRLDLVGEFGIKEGMSVLEIGCGQGDTTVAIADAVGKNGKVIGIDIASREYGAPLTLGQATDRIKNYRLGERVTFHFGVDFKTFESRDKYDVAVLSHSSWYFKRPEDLLSYFKKLRRMTKYICIAEWDLYFTHISQRAHFCAASILALYSNYVNNDGNIQNLFHKTQVIELLEMSGFQIAKQEVVDATYLQDAQWEKSYANSIRHEFANVSAMIQTLVSSYYALMNVSNENEHSLNSFILCAK
ncbi:SAM-dependent methyltransferase [Tenuibacillus multivorans]|uniref:Methyltransferase domain-containing protein n=1 Tax=Tenuibacillus multivorans TaxID=237069 RepID=A0A1H0A178_9BACI|nr:class I SAM-dependent methyltransferase [Tenuibacillus multivorans]GEL78358.1 SAM-dependent methyltransferase [Tenuibacillus multivorans]SDN27300.1 Methyltransferase domain-containing protein [Tenuibacillus multivorans]